MTSSSRPCTSRTRPPGGPSSTALLAAHAGLGSFLDGPADPPAPGPDLPPGGAVGPYRLLEVIGEGGMGTVWVAQQTDPVRRRVALKIIKPGMDSQQVIARFEAERQALALKDHPNIANRLGLAYHRLGEWREAIAAFERSVNLGRGAQPFEPFVLAMAHHQLSEKEKARTWYDKGVQWMAANRTYHPELDMFRAEAMGRLGLNEKKD